MVKIEAECSICKTRYDSVEKALQCEKKGLPPKPLSKGTTFQTERNLCKISYVILLERLDRITSNHKNTYKGIELLLTNHQGILLVEHKSPLVVSRGNKSLCNLPSIDILLVSRSNKEILYSKSLKYPQIVQLKPIFAECLKNLSRTEIRYVTASEGDGGWGCW